MNTLTALQIQQLYTFTALHYVEFFEIQTELVDHLAHGIEAQREKNPDLGFVEALKVEFKKFGVFGFSDIIEQKQKALAKHYRKLVWKSTKAYFKCPKIIATLFSIWVVYICLSLVENKNYIVIPILIFLLVFQLYFWFKGLKEAKAIRKNTGKNWLFLNVIPQLGGIIHISHLGIQIPNFFSDNLWSITEQLVFSIGVVIWFIVCYVSVKIVSPKLKKTIAKQFPEYKFT